VLGLLALSDGKISFSEAWELPVYLRKYYIKLYQEALEGQKENLPQQKETPKVSKPDIQSKPTPKYS